MYVTKNAAYSWQAAVQESVDATLNRTVSSGTPILSRQACGFQDYRVLSVDLSLPEMQVNPAMFTWRWWHAQIECDNLLGPSDLEEGLRHASESTLNNGSLQVSAGRPTMRAASPTSSAARLATMWQSPLGAISSSPGPLVRHTGSHTIALRARPLLLVCTASWLALHARQLQ